jgi:hypothetical protein
MKDQGCDATSFEIKYTHRIFPDISLDGNNGSSKSEIHFPARAESIE